MGQNFAGIFTLRVHEAREPRFISRQVRFCRMDAFIMRILEPQSRNIFISAVAARKSYSRILLFMAIAMSRSQESAI